MTTKTHTYEREKIVTEQETREVTYCNSCGSPVPEAAAIPLFHGPATEADGPLHFHPYCYQVLIRPPEGGTFEITEYDDFMAFAEAAAAARRERAGGPRYRVPGTAWVERHATALTGAIRDILRAPVSAVRSLPGLSLMVVGMVIMAVGAYALSVWIVALGGAMMIVGNLWLVSRLGTR